MKMFPESQLPLKPKGMVERYLLYAFESRSRWLGPQVGAFVLLLAMWGITQLTFFGVFAAVNLFSLYLGVEARAISKMVKRDSLDHERVA
jgi:hypothetical protein